MTKNTTIYQKLLIRLQALKKVHYECAEIYNKYNMYLNIPSIGITALASIASFLSLSEYVPTDQQNICSLIVGILSVGSTMMQSLNNTLKYSAKIESHQLAGDEYNKLLTKLQFEAYNPNEENFLNKIEEKILEIKNNCKYFPINSVLLKYDDDLSLKKFVKSSTYNNTNSESNSTLNNTIINEDNENTKLLKNKRRNINI